MKMLIDVHCHLDHPLYEVDLDNLIEKCKKAGVVRIITAGIDHNSNRKALELAKKYDIVEAAFGRYPEGVLEKENYPGFVKSDLNDDIDFIRKNRDKCIAIGECGLDQHTGNNIELQIQTFEKMIELAIELNKPIIIHSLGCVLKVPTKKCVSFTNIISVSYRSLNFLSEFAPYLYLHLL